jgi:hypothetical protein
MRNAYKILVGKEKGRGHSEDIGMDGRIILKGSYGRWELDSSNSGQGQEAGSYKHGNESSGSIEGGNFMR